MVVHALAGKRERLVITDRMGLGRHPSPDRALSITHRDYSSGADMWFASGTDGKIC
ncbi:hypothetical protein [Enhygromyxa salina]|uniref:hypothetical protein n=1 Tax=Enhygromyxa salina TaxID=215803 RepID=UPI001FD2C78F|nr:hypothetical protein [Enhygromyxa salina]